MCKDHQKDRVSEKDTIVSFDFTEGWFRNSGLYNIGEAYRSTVAEVKKEIQISKLKQFQDEKANDTVVDSESTTGKSDQKLPKGKTRDIAAKKMGISPHTVDTIKKAKELEDKCPEIKEKLDRVRKGDKTVTVKSIRKEIAKVETAQKGYAVQEYRRIFLLI